MNHPSSRDEEQEPSIWKGLLAGTVAGVVASVVMNQFQGFVGKHVAGIDRSHGAQSLQHGSPADDTFTDSSVAEDEHDDATERIANTSAKQILGRELNKSEKRAREPPSTTHTASRWEPLMGLPPSCSPESPEALACCTV